MLVSADQTVAVQSKAGVTVYQFNPSEYSSMEWTRELREVSRCDLQLPPAMFDYGLPDIIPWLHELAVYDEYDALLWRGPVQKLKRTRQTMSINAKDAASFMARTRNPFTKRWDAIDPSVPAAELWRSVISQHGLRTSPIVRPDPDVNRFDYAVTADAEMVDKAIDQLVQSGLSWTIVAGVIILGPAMKEPFVTLGEADFIGDGITIERDGSKTANDILVRGPDNLARGRVNFHGLNLQDIANVDSMFSVSNVERAVQQQLRYLSQVRDAVTLDDDAQLHPDAPLSIHELIPSGQVVVDAFNLRNVMEIEKVTVQVDSAGVAVKPSFEIVPVTELPELVIAGMGKDRPAVSRGRQASI